MMVGMNKVLYHLCCHSVSIMYGWMPCPAAVIAREIGVSVSTARRRLRELKSQGYAKTYSIRLDFEGESPLPYNGWTITDKARETEEYKLAEFEEKRICRKVLGLRCFRMWRMHEDD